MANGHGGYRQPTNPSPVSGPGALSRRTDGPMHAPVPGSAPSSGAQAGAPVAGPDPSQLTPLDADSQRPDEPIFAGMSGGPGAGPSTVPGADMTEEDRERMRSYLPVLIFQASMPNASPALKQYVRQLRGELG